jgi:hypothetical protein
MEFEILEDIVLPPIVPGPKKGSKRMNNHNLVCMACDKVINEGIAPHVAARFFLNEWKTNACLERSKMTMFTKAIRSQLKRCSGGVPDL